MTLGEKLRKIRGDRRLSLLEISRATRIQVSYLESLENGEYDKLPADVYVKGFLRNYAEFLVVNEQALIKLYEKEKGIKKNLEQSKSTYQNKTKAEPVRISSFVFTLPKIAITLAIVLIVLGFVYLYNEIGSFAHAPRLVVLSPRANAELEGNSVTVEGVTDKDAKLFINDQPTLVNDDGKFRENLTLQSGVNVINVKSVNKFQKEASETVTIQSRLAEQVAGEMDERDNEGETTDGSKEKNKELEMEIRVDPGPVWLSVEADGNTVFSGTMLTGATQMFKAQDKFVVNSGKANATFVKFNGKDIGALSAEPGAARGVTFNQDTQY